MWIFVQDGLYNMEKIKNYVSLGYTTNNKNVMTFLSDEKYTIVQHLFVKSKTKTITPTHTHDYYELEVLIGGKAIEIVFPSRSRQSRLSAYRMLRHCSRQKGVETNSERLRLPRRGAYLS